MNQSRTLETALAETERMLAEQNAELDAAFARLESLGSCPVPIDARELAELASFQPATAGCLTQSRVTAKRC
jgi:hypothetical protein